MPRNILKRTTPFTGTYTVPGDKSITHRALFFAGLRSGSTLISSPSTALDCRNTLELLGTLGHHILDEGDSWLIHSSERSSYSSVHTVDCGNSGTTARLATGFLTGYGGEITLVGDESLSRRPMERVAEPLRQMGAVVHTTDGKFPVSVIAKQRIQGLKGTPIDVGSAQVHAALTLAALRSEQGVVLRRTKPMRDHTLRMAALFGFPITSDGSVDSIQPLDYDAYDAPHIDIEIPGDFSSAAFLVAAALLVPESDLTIQNVGLNPTRTAFLDALKEMGADVDCVVEFEEWEPVGRIHARYSPNLQPIVLDENSSISVDLMMDELPLLAFLASQANGESCIRGAAELRVKESDRIAATASVLRSLGLAIEELEDGFRVCGPQAVRGGVSVDHHGDHRLAIMAGVAGLIAQEPVVIAEHEVADVSWPSVWALLAE